MELNLFGFAAEKDPIAFNNRAIGGANVVEGLARLRELREREGFVVLVAVWPHFSDDGFVDPIPVPDESGDLVIERLARSNGMPVIRMSEGFAKHWKELSAAETPARQYTIGDGVHPSPYGSRVAAAVLKEQLEQLPELREQNEAKRPGPAEERLALETANALGTNEPDWAGIHGSFGAFLLDNGNPQGASRHLRVALEITPDDPELHRRLGVALAELGQFDAGIAELHRALELAPDSELARSSLRSALERKAAAGS